MPVEIRELHIRVRLDEESRSDERNSGNARRPEHSERMIQECVERVLEVIKQENQR